MLLMPHVRKSSARGNGRLCILTYHRILDAHDFSLVKMDVETFRWQMQLLADCFNVLPLHEALQMLLLKQIPPRAVCITFDDGYRSTYDLALPILKEFGLPAPVSMLFITVLVKLARAASPPRRPCGRSARGCPARPGLRGDHGVQCG